jgi:hypothetical protein
MRFIPKVKFLNYSTLENEQTFIGKSFVKSGRYSLNWNELWAAKKFISMALDGILLINFTDFGHTIETRVYKAHCFA